MASTYLTRTPSSNGNLDKWTLSVWVKRSKLQVGVSGAQYIASAGTASLQNTVYFDVNDRLIIEYYNASVGNYYKKTNRFFRDTSAWYHIVAVWDTGNSTAEDRMRLYVNGERLTSWQSSADPGQDLDGFWNSTSYANYIGQLAGDTSRFDGLMSHLHFIDGTVYEPSTFGETDSTTGEWKIKTDVSVTYGTNGFFILKDGNGITDQSGNSNNLTASCNLTSTKDCPSKVYTSWNYLNRSVSSGLQSSGWQNGGTFIATETANNHRSFGSTLAFPGTGKFYCEFKIGNLGGAAVIGIMESEEANSLLAQTNTGSFSDNSSGWGYKNNGYKENGGSSSAYGASFVNYSYLMLAYNNGALWFGKDGTWANSATSTEIANATTTNAAYSGLDTSKDYHIMFRGYNDSMIELNAGNGHFRTTTDGSNNPSTGDTGALFKYAVPTGLHPVSTKGFNA